MNRMGVCFDRLRCEVFQNLILSPMNTGFLGPAVATALTVYGIETGYYNHDHNPNILLQQHLPFTVLKPVRAVSSLPTTPPRVATALTVYGIETK